MTIRITINYHAQWGQSLCLVGRTSTRHWDEQNPLMLQCVDGDRWETLLDLSDFESELIYKYAVIHRNGAFEYERGDDRELPLGWAASTGHVVDYWRNMSLDDVFHSSLYTDALFLRPKSKKSTLKGDLIFSIDLPRVQANECVGVMGNIPELGEWDSNRKLVLSDANFPVWRGGIKLKERYQVIEYKYVIFDKESGKVLDLEYGENRRLWLKQENDSLYINDFGFRYTRPAWRGAGVALPVFSLRTNDGFGVGEFSDLKKLVDWAVLTGMKMIQTLPINDTTMLWTNKDSYPYSTVSVFALHPLYLHLESIGTLADAQEQARFEAKKKELNSLDYVNYSEITALKWNYIRSVYPKACKSTFASADYKKWFAANQQWLVPYAAFCYLRDKFGSPNFHQWPQYSVYQSDEIHMLALPDSLVYDDIALHFYLQFHLHMQMTEAKTYAHALGVALKGVIPIGSSPDSVEAWTHPELFNLNSQAGAPPDSFSISGQNWGFPTYNWDVMERDGYAWWRKRFQKMADYFDAYRIDHILGFFRIWEMSKDEVWGLTGRFSPALPYASQDLWEMGIQLNEDRLLKPYIRASYLPEIFGVDAEHVKERFLYTYDFDTYYFKPEFNTQKKVEAYFACNNLNDERSIRIRNGLYYLHCEVLFVRDLKCPELLHPRIALYQSYSYKALDEDTKQKLSCLHEDFFYHRHNDFWKASALRKLPALINATNMLVCGEDLGMVPACVPDVMHQLQILSLEIQRMPKEPNVEFAHPANAPYLSVCTTGTHDTNPLRAWWEENRIVTQHFYNNIMGYSGEAPMECTPEIASFIINQHIYSPAMWVILPLQDWLAIDADVRLPDAHAERINIPDNSHHFWCYRMHLNLEDLISNDGFNQKMLTLIKPRL